MALDEFCESTVGYANSWNGAVWRRLFDCDSFRVNSINDVAGVELCGALKNVVALGAGFCDGLGLGGNTKVRDETRRARKEGGRQRLAGWLASSPAAPARVWALVSVGRAAWAAGELEGSGRHRRERGGLAARWLGLGCQARACE